MICSDGHRDSGFLPLFMSMEILKNHLLSKFCKVHKKYAWNIFTTVAHPKRRPADGQQDAGPKKPPRAPIIGVLPCSPSSYLPFSFYFLCSLSLQPQLRDATSPWGQWPWPFGGVIIQVSGSNEIILSNEAAYLCPPLSPNFLP